MKKYWFLLIFIVFLIPFFFFQSNQKSYAVNSLVLNFNGYEENTWTNKDVTINFPNEYSNCFYKLDGDWIRIDGRELVISNEGDFNYLFKASDVYDEFSDVVSARIKIDKTAPTDVRVLYSNSVYTNQDVQVIILGLDNLSGIEKYKVGNSEYSENNYFYVNKNTTFLQGQIVVCDYAGNIAYLQNDLVIDKIDKLPISFNVNYEKEKIEKEKILIINIAEPISKIQSVKIEYNGVVEDITSSYKNGYKITQNGQYKIIVQNGIGLTEQQIIVVENIGFYLSVEVQIYIMLSELLLSFAMILDIIRRKKKIHNRVK